jgi:hypothetical protein
LVVSGDALDSVDAGERPGDEELLSDARLALAYAVRAGRLPSDALPNAIAAIEGVSPGERVTKIASLGTALNAVVGAIAPMTLVDLRARRSPFDTPPRATRVLQVCLGVFTIVVIGMVAYFTQVLHQGDLALQALQRIQEARPLDKLNNARKMAQKEGALGKQDSQYDQYQRSVADLRDLQDKVAAARELADAIILRPSFPFQWALSKLPSRLLPWDGGSAPLPGPAAAEAQAPAPAPAPASEVTDAAARPQMVPAADDEASDSMQKACANVESAASANANPAAVAPVGQALGTPAWLCRVFFDVADEFRFSTTLGLGLYSNSRLPSSSLTYRIQSDMATLNGWVLPLMYGFLGAAVFLIRGVLDTRTANIEIFSSILRVALGGIAGIVIGWFWVPSPSKTAELAAITSTPFALAFLAGFSVDILFSLLDRLNRLANTGGVSPTGGPGGAAVATSPDGRSPSPVRA